MTYSQILVDKLLRTVFSAGQINTGLYSDLACELVSYALTYMSKYCRNCILGRSAIYLKCELSPEHEAVILLDSERLKNYCLNSIGFLSSINSASKLKQRVASMLYETLKQRTEFNRIAFNRNIWNKKNTEKFPFKFNNTILDEQLTIDKAYAIYAQLKTGNASKHSWPKDVVDAVVGQPADPIQAEIEREFRIEKKRIEQEYAAKIEACSWDRYAYSMIIVSDKDLNKIPSCANEELAIEYEKLAIDFDQKRKEMEDRISRKWDKLKEECIRQRDSAIAKLESTLKMAD